MDETGDKGLLGPQGLISGRFSKLGEVSLFPTSVSVGTGLVSVTYVLLRIHLGSGIFRPLGCRFSLLSREMEGLTWY